MRYPRKNRRASLVLAVNGLFLVACGSPVGVDQQIDFSTDRARYAIGDTAWLTVTNRGPDRVWPRDMMSCSLEAERRVGEAWEFFSEPGRLSCRGLNPLESGEEIRRWIVVTGDDFEPGSEYRFKTRHVGTSRTSVFEIFSNSFVVESEV